MGVGIIVAGHGHFGTGITSALELIAGVPDDYVAIDFPAGMAIGELEERFDRALARLGKREVVMLVDLFGGSPFNVAMRRASEDQGLRLLYGVNFGMLLELAMRVDGATSADELVEGLVEVGRESVGQFMPEALSALDDSFDDEDEEDDL